MRMKYTLAVLLSLGTVINLPASGSDVYFWRIQNQRWTWKVMLSQELFTEFYNCLCKGTTLNCSVNYKNETLESSGKQNNSECSCKFYKCQHIIRYTITCTQVLTGSSYSPDKYTFIKVKDNTCGSNIFVAFFNGNFQIDYRELSSVVTECKSDCCYLTTGKSTASTTKVVPTSIQRATTQAVPTSVPRGTKTYTRRTTSTAVVSTATHSSTRNVETSTEANITISKLTSNSDNKTDNIAIILGVIIPIVIIIAVAAAIVVFLGRRKRRLSHKHSSEEHEHVNIAKTVNLPNGALQSIPNSTLNASDEYSYPAFDNPTEIYTSGETTNSQNSGSPVNDDSSKIKPEFVYSTAESLDNIANKDSNVVGNACYSSVDNTIDETDDAATSIYTIATKHNLEDTGGEAKSIYTVAREPNALSNLNHSQPMEDALTGNAKRNPQKYAPKNHLESVNKDGTKVGFGRPQNGSENSFSGYQNIQPRSIQNVKVAKIPRFNRQQKDPTTNSEAPAHKQPSSQTSATSSTHRSVEYSVAGMPQYPTNENIESESTHAYAKLREEVHKIQNPYDDLLSTQPSQANSPKKAAKALPSGEEYVTNDMNMYSTATSVQGWASQPVDSNDIGIYHDSPSQNSEDPGNERGASNSTSNTGIYFELEPE